MSAHPLHGRSAEITQARRALQAVVREGHGAVLVVEGAAGMGKTAFWRMVTTEARRLGYATGVGTVEEVGRLPPGSPLLVALRSGGDPLLDAETFAGLSSLLGEPPFLVDRIADEIGRLAQRAPVLIGLDDVHRADPLTRFAVRLLMGRLAGSAVAWSFTRRSSTEVPGPAVDEPRVAVHRMRLGPLGPDDVDRLTVDVLGRLPAAPVQALLHAVGGTPSWATRLLARLQRPGGGPVSVDDLRAELALGWHQRLSAQSADVADLVRLLAVWDRTMSFAEAAELTGRSEPEVRELARHATVDGLAEVDATTLAIPRDFRGAACAELPPTVRRRLHRRIGRSLLDRDPAAVLPAAVHYRAGGLAAVDQEAGEVLLRAARDVAASMPGTAARMAVDAGRHLDPAGTGWADAVEECLEILIELQHSREVIALADELRGRTGDLGTRGRLQFYACRALWALGRISELRRRVALVRTWTGVSPVTRLRLDAVAAMAATRTDPAADAGRAASVVLRTAMAQDDLPAQRVAMTALREVARNEGRHQVVLDHTRELRRLGYPGRVTEEIRCLQVLGRHDEAQALLVAARTEHGGTTPALSFAQMHQYLELGRIDEAEVEAETTLRLCDELGQYGYKVRTLLALAAAAVFRGRPREARRIVAPLELLAEGDPEFRTTEWRLTSVLINAADGDLDAAVATIRELLPAARESRDTWPWHPHWLREFTRICLDARMPGLAGEVADLAEIGAERNPGMVSLAGIALQTRGLATRDVGLLGRAVDVLEGGPDHLRAFACADYGRALLEYPDRRAEGVELLTCAVELLDRIRAVVAAETARRALAGTGRPAPRRRRRGGPRPETGWESLTDAELRVARLVSAGDTNREVARKLAVSPNTVNTHLRAVFAKLAVHSRVQLVNALREHPPARRGRAGPPRPTGPSGGGTAPAARVPVDPPPASPS